MRTDLGTRSWLVVGCVLAASAWGCGDGDDSGFPNGVESSSAASGGGHDDIDDFEPNPDNNGDGIPDTGPGCSAVDILFVIDNSPSMKPYQEGLAAAFPSFVDAMFEVLPGNIDLHVGMTTSSFYNGNCGEGHVNCQTTATPEEVNAHYVTPMAGDTMVNGEQGRLFEYEGKRFYTTNTNDKDSGIKEWFGGAAVAAGEAGCSFEMTSAGASYALHPANEATNAGFLRDDKTLLLMFVLSDEPDKSPESMDTYKKIVRDSKKGCGGDACIVTSGLVTPCVMAGQNQLYDFLTGFGESSVLGSIEEPEKYTDVVGAGLAQVVQEACAQIDAPK